MVLPKHIPKRPAPSYQHRAPRLKARGVFLDKSMGLNSLNSETKAILGTDGGCSGKSNWLLLSYFLARRLLIAIQSVSPRPHPTFRFAFCLELWQDMSSNLQSKALGLCNVGT